MRARSLWALLPALLSLLGLAACDGEPMSTPDASADAGSEDGGPPPEPDCTVYAWEPGVGSLATWPSMEMMAEDPSTPTGYRFAITEEAFPEVPRYESYARLFTEDLSRIDGFGVHAAAYLRFGRAFDTGRLPGGSFEPDPSLGYGFVVMPEGGEPALWPARLQTTDEGATLVVIPNRPLPPKSRAAVFVSRALTEAGRGCLEPSEGMASMLQSPEPALAEAISALTALFAIGGAEELVALQPFVTESVEEEALAIAGAIGESSPSLEGITCDPPEGGARHCVGTIEAGDFRDEAGVVRIDPADPRPSAMYTLPVHAWLPTEVAGPYPVILFGHGLSSSAEEHGPYFARRAASEGIATVAVSAVAHPGHPTNEGGATGIVATLNFFAADTARMSIEILRLRDHFQQSAFDKLAVARLLAAAPDLDGDEESDVDPERLSYVGVSLGAIMGPQLLALTDVFSSSVLVMPGGRVTSLLSDPEGSFGDIRRVLVPRSLSLGDQDRLFPILQTAFERGDAAAWGPALLHRRFPSAGEAPSLLVHMALDDQVVTNGTTYTFARATGIEILPPELRGGHGLGQTAPAPLRGNLAEGARTAAMIQFDSVADPEGGAPIPATHTNLSGSEVSYTALFHFLQSHWEGGVAEVLDPYEVTGLSHLE